MRSSSPSSGVVGEPSSVGVGDQLLHAKGRTYRGFIHPPRDMFRMLRQRGLELRSRRRVTTWIVAAVARP